MSGYWVALGRSWRISTPTVLGLAAVQAGLTAASAAWPAGIAFWAPVSFLATAAAAMLLAAGAAAAARADARPRWNIALATTAVLAVLVVSAAGLPGQAWALLALPPAAIALSAAAMRSPVFAAFRRHPVVAAVAVVVTVLAGALVWLAALLLAFFLTGPLASALVWLVTGLAATKLLVWWSRLRLP